MDNAGSDTQQMAGLCHCPMRLVTMAGKEIECCELTLISEDARSPLNDPVL